MTEPTTQVKRGVDRMLKKSTGQTLITDAECSAHPLTMDTGRCRGRVRIYVNRAIGGNWCQCSKRPRLGKLTCHWHRQLEGDE